MQRVEEANRFYAEFHEGSTAGPSFLQVAVDTEPVDVDENSLLQVPMQNLSPYGLYVVHSRPKKRKCQILLNVQTR